MRLVARTPHTPALSPRSSSFHSRPPRAPRSLPPPSAPRIPQGEFYQLILDGILDQTHRPAPDHQKADNILNWDVLRGAAKLIGLDDDALADALKVRLHLIYRPINPYLAPYLAPI